MRKSAKDHHNEKKIDLTPVQYAHIIILAESGFSPTQIMCMCYAVTAPCEGWGLILTCHFIELSSPKIQR